MRYILRPTNDLLAEWTEAPAGTAASALREEVLAPTAGDTATKISSATTGKLCTIGFDSVTLNDREQVVSVTFNFYAKATQGLIIFASTGNPLGEFFSGTSYEWVTISAEVELDQAEVDGLTATMASRADTILEPVDVEVATVYAEIETAPRRETIVIDPFELAPARTELELGRAPIMVGPEGIDWGDAEVAAHMAEEGKYGEVPVDLRIPNRTVTIPLLITTAGHEEFAEIRTILQSKVGQLRTEGGVLRRITAEGLVLYIDVVNATLHLSGGTTQAQQNLDAEGVLTLEALPDFYGEETSDGIDHTETTGGELVFTASTVRGDMPARMRLVVDEDNGRDQRGLIAAIRGPTYDNAATARPVYEAGTLTPLDLAASGALTGASGGSAVTHAAIANNWTPVLSTYLAGVGDLTHRGTYRCFARVYSSAGSTVRLRLIYDIGDLTQPSESAAWRFPGDSAFYIADLGELQLQPSPVGNHRWHGVIQAIGDSGGESVSIDKLWLLNEESLIVCRAPINLDPGLREDIARDSFNQTAGALTGKAVPTGGTWQGAGDADDANLDTTNHVALRTAVSDADRYTGRWLNPSAAAALGATVISADIYYDWRAAVTGDRFQGVFARYTDASNWVLAGIADNDMTGTVDFPDLRFVIVKRVAGSIRIYYNGFPIAPTSFPWMPYTTILLAIDTAGQISVQFGTIGIPLFTVFSWLDPDLAAGGALATGKAGIYDVNTSAQAIDRTFDNVRIYSPPTDAVAFGARSIQLTSEGIFREDSGALGYGPVSIIEGALPRLPVSGAENREAEICVKLTRSDLDTLPDSGIDDLSAQLFVRPSYLFAPHN